MQVSATTDSAATSDADAIAVGVFADQPFAGLGAELVSALVDRGEARATARHLAVTHLGERPLIVVGLGPRAAFDDEAARRVAAVTARRAGELGVGHLCWELPADADQTTAEALVTGTVLAEYRFDRFKASDPERPTGLRALTIAAPIALDALVSRAAVIADAQNRARDLGNAPPNLLSPAALADYAGAMAADLDGLECHVVDGDEIGARGMGLFAAVAQGSEQAARMIVLRYDGPSTTGQSPRLALIGKAVTFDSGGLNLKPGASMVRMKFDMVGGAAVIETMGALARLAAPVRVLAVIGATENMTGGGAMRPGDILTALDGTTVEMNNADAEGRLVLADCITHARREGCAAIVDIATLTGGVVTALGSTYAGLLSNDDALAQLAGDTGTRTGELLWRLPLHPSYAEMVKGRYAQLTNLTERREASSITAAEFLHHFAGDVPWVHLDIAGVGDGGHAPYLDKGATGFGVRLLTELALGF